jgi:hypothetical protein
LTTCLLPVVHLGASHVERPGLRGMALHCAGGGAQVVLGHQVRVDVVVGQRAVLVRSRDAVDSELAAARVVAKRLPEPSRLHEQLQSGAGLEPGIPGDVHVADDSVSDVGVDMERGPR